MQKLLQVAEIIQTLNRWIGKFAYWLVLIMVAVGGWNVVGRYVGKWIGQPLTSNALIEIQWYLFDLVFLLGAAYTLQKNGHVRVDIIYKNFGEKGRAIANLIGTLLFLIPFSLMVIYFSWGTIVNSWQILEMSPDPGGLPRYPIKSMIIVSFALLLLQGFADTINNLAIIMNLTQPQENHE
ncbi:Tripartite ATP-independent periplasmic transporter DctQ component [Halothece sp. PCC 7418]|uniref:TRAP transporter small permease subunit n=1 Tax=Halothece sp. (strain PCC 7418) TaxID=65093 RepID=UPI0002A082D3|nr:TRAP transporter small permease subunit [Halothece sp. PCC 7418]AFZ42881.1 Tripartite ATP-independent periplasmic transporter DctQ component [Halothece sp. PCC 7418]